MDILNQDESLLFKFIPINLNLIRLLVNSEIWFSTYYNLNDPFEGEFEIELKGEFPNDDFIFDWYQKRSTFKHSIYKTKQLITKIKKDYSIFYRDLKTDLKVCYFNRLKIASFSQIYNEILLWSHYADEHKGLCLIFDKAILKGDISFKNSLLDLDFVDAKKIKYGMREKLKVTYEKSKSSLPIKNLHAPIFKKLKCWSYEKEYRIVYKDVFSTIPGGNNIKFEKEALRGVIFGEKCLNSDIRLVSSILTTNGYVDSDFLWGASKIVPSTGKLVSIQEYDLTDSEKFLSKRNSWLHYTHSEKNFL